MMFPPPVTQATRRFPIGQTPPLRRNGCFPLKKTFATPFPWSLYIHIPFCETLCAFCGCNTSITKNHGREEPYIELLLKEFENYKNRIPKLTDSPLEQLHFGGGTPTFLGPRNLYGLTKKFSQVLISVGALRAPLKWIQEEQGRNTSAFFAILVFQD